MSDDPSYQVTRPSPTSPCSIVLIYLLFQVHDSYHLFEKNEADEINFIFASEASGFRHLYHINAQLTPPLITSDSTGK